jgi:hypothetical protein
MKSLKSFLPMLALALVSLNGCKSNKGDIQDLKGILEKQKDKTTVQVKVEGSDFTELYFLRNDALQPRMLYIKIGNDVQVDSLREFWRGSSFSTSYHKDNGVYWVKFRNNLDSAVIFSKYYLYDVLKIDPQKKLNFKTTEDTSIE